MGMMPMIMICAYTTIPVACVLIFTIPLPVIHLPAMVFLLTTVGERHPHHGLDGGVCLYGSTID